MHNRWSLKTITAVLGLTLAGCFCTVPALAQDDMDMTERYGLSDEEMDIDPAPPEYPVAAPGGIHLWHWATYRKFTARPGSVANARYYKRKQQLEKLGMREEQLKERVVETDEEALVGDPDVDPAPASYPVAAPGAIDMWHWASYRQFNARPGSARDARHAKRMARLEKLGMRTEEVPTEFETDEEALVGNPEIDPAPASYPAAAPGGIHLWHWATYRKLAARPGSVNDARYAKDKEKRKDLPERKDADIVK